MEKMRGVHFLDLEYRVQLPLEFSNKKILLITGIPDNVCKINSKRIRFYFAQLRHRQENTDLYDFIHNRRIIQHGIPMTMS